MPHALAADGVQGGVFYHNVLGIIPSSAESYDPIKAKEHWELSTRCLTQALGRDALPEAALAPPVKGINPGKAFPSSGPAGHRSAAAPAGPAMRDMTPARAGRSAAAHDPDAPSSAAAAQRNGGMSRDSADLN
jgi:hypothetical protein